MAEKEYFWVKLNYQRFENGGDLDFLMSQKNGAEYVVLYMMLCLNTRNTEGEFVSKMGEMIIPYDIEKIVRDCKYFSIDTVRVALEIYKKLGLIYIQENGNLMIANFDDMVGSESSSASRVRAFRKRKKEEALALQCNNICNDDVTQEYRDKSIEIRDKNIEKDKYIKDNSQSSLSFSSEPSCENSEEQSEKCEKPKIYLSFPTLLQNPNKNNDEDDPMMYNLTVNEYERFKKTYTGVDVDAEIRKALSWCWSNKPNRKTAKGMPRFLNNWLSNAQNRSGRFEQDKRNPYNPRIYVDPNLVVKEEEIIL